jgi:hypothetical protein
MEKQPPGGYEAASLGAWSSGAHFSDSAGKNRLYGALLDQRLLEKARAADSLKARKRVNILPIMISLLAPWLAFIGAFFTSGFYMHYAAPLCTKGLMFVAFVMCLAFIADASQARAAGKDEGFFRSYFAVAVTMAVLAGFMFGDLTFWTCSRPIYEIQHMATYGNVDPSFELLWSGELQPTRGKQFQDAGAIYFNSKAVVDRNKSSSFKMGQLYCVAPIVNPACGKDCGHDFWAVGVDCCSEDSAHFQCDSNNLYAKSGLRMMDDSQRPFFRLAVLQAEGAHGIHSTHPIFLQWVQDPIAETRNWEMRGYRRFVLGMCIAFPLNAVILALYLQGALYGKR